MRQGFNQKWEFARLLKAGATIKQAQMKLGIPRATAYRWATNAVRDASIEPASIWPRTFRPKLKNETGVIPGGDFPIDTPPFLPHRYGASFMITGRIQGLQYDKTGRFFIKESTHTAQIGRSKAVIWLKAFRTGQNAQEVLKLAFEDVMALAAHYGQKFNQQFTLTRVYEPEWAATSKELSKKADQMLEIGQQKEIGGATWKIDDKSHPDVLEINQAPGMPAHIPAAQVAALEYFLQFGLRHLELLTRSADALDRRVKELEAKL